MSTHNEPEDLEALAHSQTQGYETRDVPVLKIGKAALGFYIFTVAAFAMTAVAVFMFYRIFTSASPMSHTALSPRGQLPPAPLLQSNITTKTDIMNMRAAETKALTTYGWVDEGAGIARVPVADAIDILAAKGLPIASMREGQR